MEKEIILTQAIFGMGNANHDHVHRHNIMNPNSMMIDTLKMEQFQGGIKGTTLQAVAEQSGGLSAQPGDYVHIEDGFNVRRGIGMLRFQVTRNSQVSIELVVLAYLTGGSGASVDGIPPETMFVPVRAWSSETKNVQDNLGFPMPTTSITSSQQFLLGDPFDQHKLKAIRPMDVANEALGFLACEQDGIGSQYDGTLGTNLSKTVVSSKTQNLNPTHHAKELLKLATNTGVTAQSIGLENAFSDSMGGVGIQEASLTDNEFFQAMMFNLGTSNMMNGFQGWSVQEIASVFTNLPNVLNLDLLNPSTFTNVNNLMDSMDYGRITSHEIIASELAFLTVHLLIQVGLTHLVFAATNNPHDFRGMQGSEDGVEIVNGEFGSVLSHDEFAINRVEQFKQLLKAHFFAKYSTGYVHSSHIINVMVTCSVFGETSVEIFFNGEPNNTQRFVNATYCINRTSTNITASQSGLKEAKNLMSNIRDHFA